MSGDRRAGPSVPGCAFGFGCAGLGIGAYAGMGLSRVFVDPGPLSEVQRVLLLYEAAYWGMLGGAIGGGVAGIAYARAKRRRAGAARGAAGK